ncbi:MAG TPA: hypothetical protein VNP04_30665 [Alphaproteobacteria bacterium]|nr:hypothetical protein [Alphaproteobacteria bacterium]
MRRAVPLLLVAVLIGIPLGLAPKEAVLVAAGGAALCAVAGVLIGSASLLIVGVGLGLVEALVAFTSGGGVPNLGLAVLLGVVIYLLLDIGAFLSMFRGVSLAPNVIRMKATYWAGLALGLGATALTVGLLAALLARPSAHSPLLYLLIALTAAIAVGAVLGALRVWRRRADDVLIER